MKKGNSRRSKKGVSVPSVLITVEDELSETGIQARVRETAKMEAKPRENERATNKDRQESDKKMA